MRHRNITCCLISALLCLASLPAGGATQVGRSVFSRGAVSAQQQDGAVRLLGRGGTLLEGDVVSTGPRSVAVLRFEDGTRMTLRPNTVFAVEQFTHRKRLRARKTRKESMVVRLFKGGLRAITGLIGKRNPAGFALRTSVATIGIRGTDFEARLCGDDCRAEAARRARRAGAAPAAARVVFVRGTVSATDSAGKARPLAVGADLLEGDTVETARRSLAVLVFRDKTRVTLRADTEFRIEQHRYVPSAPVRSRGLLRLIKGGLRMVTGLIGRRRPEAFRVATPVATIGIRGTKFDLQCIGKCFTEPEASAMRPSRAAAHLLDALVPSARAQAEMPAADGLVTYVIEGSIEFILKSGKVVVNANEVKLFLNNVATPIVIPKVPQLFLRPLPPPPEGQNTFSDDPEPGLYVTTLEGETDVDGVIVPAGGTVFANPETGTVAQQQSWAVPNVPITADLGKILSNLGVIDLLPAPEQEQPPQQQEQPPQEQSQQEQPQQPEQPAAPPQTGREECTTFECFTQEILGAEPMSCQIQ